MAATVDDILQSHRTRQPIVMGILNVTPDSFSDGGQFFSPAEAVAQAQAMIDQGADVIDIGPESTRPGSERVTPAEQIERIEQILPAVTEAGAVVSIDTTSAQVAEFALDAGAAMINDVSAGRDDPDILALAAERRVPICLMHMLGEPKTMQKAPRYGDVVADVSGFLVERVDAARSAGVAAERIIVDPGVGFGKLLAHNLSLLARIDQLAAIGYPVLVGPSRKRFIGELTGTGTPADRVAGTLAACVICWQGGASIFRVHDVAPTVQALTVAQAIANAR
ncbi:MAG: dihydropteroate synthase [Planctomycetota bacterium]